MHSHTYMLYDPGFEASARFLKMEIGSFRDMWEDAVMFIYIYMYI